MKKKVFIAVAIIAVFAACNNAETTTPKADSSSTSTATPKVGGDRDAHNCIGSAGYTWSILKNDCIRTFEVANVKLEPAKDTASYKSTANVIFNADTSKMEVFLPNQTGGIILDRSGQAGNYVWQKDDLEITTQKGYTLKSKGVVIYEKK